VIRFVISLAVAAATLFQGQERILVSVSASVNDALVEIVAAYRTSAGVTIDLNSAGSNTLARQIAAGAPADLFLSADETQMDVVARADRLVRGTRTNLLTNELTVIVPANSTIPVKQASDLASAGVKRLAMGEPAAVPVGVYGKKWLEKQNLWTAVSPKVVPFPTVLAVLTAVDAGRVDAGIVYKTDAMTRSNVRVAISVPAKANPELSIVLPAAVIRGAHEEAARKFLAYLKGPEARAVFVRKGFGVP
jgi:molybdate transport system substrate-binding protein